MTKKDLLDMNLQYFAKDNETDQTDDNSGDNKTPENATEDNKHEKTFTQEEVNGIVTKESRKEVEKTLKELGFTDFENAKDGVEKYKEWQESQKTEQEKLTENYNAVKEQHEQLQANYDSLLAENQALKAGVVADSVEDVVALAQSKVNDDVTIEDAISEVVEKYPNFLAKAEDEEEETKPRIVSSEQPNGSGTKDDNPFSRLRDKYKK